MENNEKIDVAKKNAEIANELNKIKANLENKKNAPAVSVERTERNPKDATFELETGNKDLDKKIAEYYKRKQEKINQYNAESEVFVEEEKKNDDNEPVDYDAIFNGSMTTRDELFGIAPKEEVQETKEEIVEEIPTTDTANIEEVSAVTSEIHEEKEEPKVEEQPVEENSSNADTTAPAEETPVEQKNKDFQEEQIKTILSDLLFGNRVRRENKMPQRSQEEAVEEVEPSKTEGEKMSQEDYESLWQNGLKEETVEEDTEEKKDAVEEEKTAEGLEEEFTTEDVVSENEEAVTKTEETTTLGDNFVMTGSVVEEEKDVETTAVVEYEERVPAETSTVTYEERDSDIEYQNPVINISEETNEESSEIEDAEDPIEEAKEVTSIETTTAKVEEDDDDDDEEDFVIRVDGFKKPELVSEEKVDVHDAEEERTTEEIDEAETVSAEVAFEESEVEMETTQNELDAEEEEKTIENLSETDVVEEKSDFSPVEEAETDSLYEKGIARNHEQVIQEDNSLEDVSAIVADEENTVETLEEEQSTYQPENSELVQPEEEEVVDEELASSNSNGQTTENIEDTMGQPKVEEIVEEEVQDNEEALYDMSEENTDLSDYIVSSNEEETTEEEFDDHFESVVDNERVYEQTISENPNPTIVDNDEEDNTYVMNVLPENKFDILGNPVKSEEEVEEEQPVEEEKEETISREEFYNEMARLQENLINELKGNKVETVSRDFFEEKVEEEPKVSEEEIETKATELAEQLIETITQEIEEEEQAEQEAQIKAEEEKKLAEEQEVGSKAEPVDPAEFDNYNLLNKEVALNEEDLEYVEKAEEEKEPEKDACFYLSPEDNEKKQAVVDEYMSVYANEPHTAKEVGDINFFKTIGNATPSSEIMKEEKDAPVENDVNEEEVEAIYTLMGIERKPVTKVAEDMKILYVASECQPFVASGGLADVAGSLPKAIAEEGGADIRVILPLYGTVKAEYRDKFEYLGNFTVHLSWRQEYCGLFRYFSDGVTYYFIDNERYFKRDKLYGYYDDGERFAYFSKAVVECLPHINFFPDIIHCNDWQSSLVSAYIKTGNWSDFRYYKIKHVYTIHNVEYQGVYGMENLKDLFGIDNRFRNDVDYNGDINLTKAAIQYSDKFTTVSHSYCDNLKQPYCSRGLHHIIIRNEYKLSGILNGIDYDFYNPATDTHIFKNFDIGCMEEKVLNKKLWQDEMGLPVDGETPMIAIVSRLVGHKGLDLIIKVIENTLQQDIQLVVVGTGDQKYVDYFKYLESKYPTKVRTFCDKYSNEIARKAYAASDIFLMPSKIEPCGLSQMIASRYGSVPIVREVGGLRDSIKDFGCEEGGNGYTFTNYNPNDLSYQLDRAIKDYSNRIEWKEKMKICMSADFTWKKPAQEYIALYKSMCDK